MKETLTGYKVEGDWEEVVYFGWYITTALQTVLEDETQLYEWNHWRPKEHESMVEEVEKTAREASVGEGKGEQEDKAPDTDLKEAGTHFEKSMKSLVNSDGADEVVEEGQKSVQYASRAVDSASRKALRKVEETIYEKVMTKISPCYFDSSLISANIRQKGVPGAKKDVFEFEIGIVDDTVREQLRAELEDRDPLVNSLE